MLFFGARARVFTLPRLYCFLTRPPGFSLQQQGRLLLLLLWLARGASERELIQWLGDKWMVVAGLSGGETDREGEGG